LKGELIMVMLPLIDCSEMLTIDPKTLRYWLQQANMPLHPHPTDARVKCLTLEQVQHLARMHHHTLKTHEARTASLVETPPLGAFEEPVHLDHRPCRRGDDDPLFRFQEEVDLRQRLAHLETQVATLQQQLTHLALELLHEREPREKHPLQALEPFAQPSLEAPGSQHDLPTRGADCQSGGAPHSQRHPYPAESRRAQVLPLIEYGAYGNYVLICPQEGELLITPDSPEWFDWLAALSSFRFVGQHGRLSARRVYKQSMTRSWYAYRTIHQHDYKHYLGTTDHVTVACLEQMAARFQSYADAF
jgi:hypothetical protein